MKTTKQTLSVLALAGATIWGASQAQASYDYQIVNSESDLVSGFNVTLDGTADNNILVGGAQVSAQGPAVPGYANFTTVCLDLKGTIYLGSTYTFNEVVYSGQTGLDPNWGNPMSTSQNTSAAYQAINNAAYLFASHQNPASATDWAALQLAVWKVLYDTGADGSVVWGSGSRFQMNYDPTQNGAAWTEATSWIAALPRTTDYAGYLLAPTDPTAQELIVGVSPVPEPTTLLAGAALLVPLGASTLRFCRKQRQARQV
jgi:hypothetical protein